MTMEIIGKVDPNRIYCTGSLSKLLTTFVSLSFLAEQYNVEEFVDEINFLDHLCTTPAAKQFLQLFQHLIGSQFTIRDLCSYYTGLPYTFDLDETELASVEAGHPFKHHHIADENTLLHRCTNKITPVYTNRCKFHYSEIAIIFLGYLLEKNFSIKIEALYQKFIIGKYQLKSSTFSRKRAANVYCQDLSDKYDYPSIAILDHGYFCYSNGFYTTLNDMKIMLENLLHEPIFNYMTNIKNARAASGRLLNGLSVEIRLRDDDIIYGYEGLSFSGCNIWAYSTKKQHGYLTCCNSEEEAYTLIYENQWGYQEFDKVPNDSQHIYTKFIKNYVFNLPKKDIPFDYQGKYQRVNINEKVLHTEFEVGNDFIIIRDPEMIKYDLVYTNNHYCIKGKDGVHGERVGFYEAKSGNKYMLYDGTLYAKLTPRHG